MAFLRNEFTPINGAYIHYIKEIEPDRKGWNFAPEWMKPMSGLSGENAPDYSEEKEKLIEKLFYAWLDSMLRLYMLF